MGARMGEGGGEEWGAFFLLSLTSHQQRVIADMRRLWDNGFSKFVVKTAVSRVVAFCAVGMGMMAAGEYMWGEPSKERNMLWTFEKGGARGWYVKKNTAHVERPELLASLKALLQPDESDNYAVVIGEHGTGKSTAVRDTIDALEDPKGVVYVSTPDVVSDFGTELAKAVGYNFVFWDAIGGFRRGMSQAEKEPLASYRPVRQALLNTATAYKKKHNRPIVLVIDAADRIAKDNPKFFGILQDFAKDCADQGLLRVVFVSSEGVALPLLQSSSAWSRSLRPIEVGEITDNQAVAYLVKRGVDENNAQDAVKNITGGRFSMLVEHAGEFQARSNAEWAEELDRRLSNFLDKAKFDANSKGFALLLECGVAERMLLPYFSSSQIDQLLKANVISLHSNGTCSFQARYIERFFERRFSGLLEERD